MKKTMFAVLAGMLAMGAAQAQTLSTNAADTAPQARFVEIEVETLEQLDEALGCGATMVLLDNMARDYRQLYQHMAKGSNDLLPNLPGQKNPFAYQLTEAEADNDQVPVQMPRDYSEGASGLLRGERPARD